MAVVDADGRPLLVARTARIPANGVPISERDFERLHGRNAAYRITGGVARVRPAAELRADPDCATFAEAVIASEGAS